MTVDNYIDNLIKEHSQNWNMHFSGKSCEYIKMQIKTGIFAFAIRYRDGDDSIYKVENIIPLDWTKVKSEDIYDRDRAFINTVWSHGAGFQYSSRETLVFNPSIIREIKLNSIINK